MISGAGTALVSVRGVDGTLQRLELPFYSSRTLLKPGTVDWSVELGYPRFKFGVENANYGSDLIAHGTLRRGMTNRTTVELHAAATRDFGHVAAGVETIVGSLAEVGFTFGSSVHEGQSGNFQYATLLTQPLGPLSLRFQASSFRASRDYLDLAGAVDRQLSTTARGPDRQRDVIGLSLRSPNGQTRFGLNHIRVRRPDRYSDLTSFGLSRTIPRLGRGTFLNVNGTHDWRSDETRLAALVTFRLGEATVQVAASNRNGTSVSLSRAGDGSIGSWGYTVDATRTKGATRLFSRVWTQRRYARAEVAARNGQGHSSVDLRLQGAFAVLDGRLTAGQKITGSFAVVDMGKPGLDVRLQNRVVARTGRHGRALVPQLQPYSRNRISLDTDDLAPDATWGVSATDIVPARGAGVHVSLGVQDRSDSQLIRVEDAKGHPLAAGTAVKIGAVRHPLGIGYDGALLLENPEPGTQIVAGSCVALTPAPTSDGTAAVARCR